MCKLLGGKWIDCSGGKGPNVGRINPLQVNPLPSLGDFDEEEEEYISSKSALALHLDFLSTFFRLYFPEISSLQMSLLMEILENLYKKFEIDYDTSIDNLKSEDFPIMQELYEILEERVREATEHKKHLEEIRSIVRELAIGHHSEVFNRIYFIRIR